MSNYKLIVYDPDTGARKGEIHDFLSLDLTMVVNNAGMARFSLDGDHAAYSDLVAHAPIEIWRDPGDGWSLLFDTVLQDEDWRWGETGPLATFTTFGQLFRVHKRVVNWPAGEANRSKFTSVATETIMKALVDYNLGANATTGNGRKRTGTDSTISVEADGANGKVTSHYCHGDNLLKTLQELALDGGGDFDLVKTGTNAWEFRWYTGQLGTDRTAGAGFSMPRGNMANPRYKVRRSQQATVAVVWGKGEEENRDYVTVNGPEYAADNDIEIYVDARNVGLGDSAGLTAKGEAVLEDRRAIKRFGFDVIQTPSFSFGQHYFLGDKVPAINPYTGLTEDQKIAAVSIQLDESGDELIDVELEPL